jgi:uncharacterized protein
MKQRRIFSTNIEIVDRAADSDGASDSPGTLTGHAAVFNQKGDGFFFTEEIAEGAFTRTLSENKNVLALWNHKSDFPLASTQAGTLLLSEDKTGLYDEIVLADTTTARDLAENVRAGIVDKQSFGFVIIDEIVDTRPEKPHFIIKDVDLIEVSPVTFPFYDGTDLNLSDRGLSEADLVTTAYCHYTEDIRIYYKPQQVERAKEILKLRLERCGVTSAAAKQQLEHVHNLRKREIELYASSISC